MTKKQNKLVKNFIDRSLSSSGDNKTRVSLLTEIVLRKIKFISDETRELLN